MPNIPALFESISLLLLPGKPRRGEWLSPPVVILRSYLSSMRDIHGQEQQPFACSCQDNAPAMPLLRCCSGVLDHVQLGRGSFRARL